MGGREIPNGLDAAFNELIANALGVGCGHGDDAHEHLVASAEILQFTQVNCRKVRHTNSEGRRRFTIYDVQGPIFKLGSLRSQGILLVYG